MSTHLHIQSAAISVLIALHIAAMARADIVRWDTGEVIPETEGIIPGPAYNSTSSTCSTLT